MNAVMSELDRKAARNDGGSKNEEYTMAYHHEGRRLTCLFPLLSRLFDRKESWITEIDALLFPNINIYIYV